MKDESEIIRLARPVGDSDHVLGPQQSAPATLIEYGDYECPYCRQLHPIIQEIMRRTEGLRFIYRHFPISKLHPHAMRAAEAAGEKAVSGSCTTCCLNKTSHSMMNASRVAPEKPGSHREGLERDGRRRLRERVDEDFKAALFGGGVTGTPTLYLKEVRLNSIRILKLCSNRSLRPVQFFKPVLMSEQTGSVACAISA
jgi:thiol-disulfide isomerase/thioredoxin